MLHTLTLGQFKTRLDTIMLNRKKLILLFKSVIIVNLWFPIVNSLSSTLTIAVDGFNMAALSVDVSVRLKNSVSSSTLSSRIGTVTI